MKQNDIRSKITDISDLVRGDINYDGFIFSAIRHPANVFDAILLKDAESSPHLAKTCSSLPLCNHIDYIKKHHIEKATISSDNISFLEQCPSLKHINLFPVQPIEGDFDFTPLYRHPEIKSLRCFSSHENAANTNELDYSKVHGLQDLAVTSHDSNFQHASALKTLRISDYDCRDLNGLFCSKEMDTLDINACKIRTLDGIDYSPKMQCVYLSYNRYLQDITGLERIGKTLKALRIMNCPKVRDFSVLSSLRELECLFLEGGNTIPNIDFVMELPNLKTLIINMEIESGNLIPCLHLSYVFCGKVKRYYNVKAKDFPRGAYYRGDENIELWRRIR